MSICPTCSADVDLSVFINPDDGDWHASTCKCGAKLVTVVYLHHVTDLRENSSKAKAFDESMAEWEKRV